MKHLKKLVALLLAAVLCLSCAACGGGGDAGTTPLLTKPLAAPLRNPCT